MAEKRAYRKLMTHYRRLGARIGGNPEAYLGAEMGP
jgi:hypothetical protein